MYNLKHALLIPVVTLALLPATASAVVVSFETDAIGTGGNGIGSFLDGLSGSSTPISILDLANNPTGLTLTVTNVTGSNAELNSVSANFGIGSDSGGTLTFESGEAFTFQFNQAVIITQVDLASFTGTESISVAGTTIIDTTQNPDDIVTTNISVGANQDIIIAGVSGGVSVQAINVEIVPEPSSAILMATAFVILGFRRRCA